MSPKKPADRKKLLIYAGVAGAMLALVVLMKRKGAATGEEAAGSSLPTYASAPSSIPGAEGGGGSSGELSSFENSLSAQLPQAIEEGVRAGLLANQSSTMPQSNLAETIAALGGFVTALRPSGTGEQVTGSAPSPSAPAPTPTPAPHPVTTTPPAPKPAPPPAYKTITCGNGCPGHKYPDGHAECMTKKAGKCAW